MNGWCIACAVIGMLIVIDTDNPFRTFIGALMVIIPIYFTYWR